MSTANDQTSAVAAGPPTSAASFAGSPLPLQPTAKAAETTKRASHSRH